MTELSPVQEEFYQMSWSLLNRAKVLFENKRIARAQEALTEALTASNSLPREFTDDAWNEQFKQLHTDLYRGV